MYNGYKVKIFIFAGRKRTMEVLLPQIKSPYIDEIIIAKNTKNPDDLQYINSLKDKFEKIKYIELPPNKVGNFTGWSYLYNFMMDEDSIYIKLDDDIVYLSDNFFDNLLAYRFNHPEYICSFPVIVNNSYTAALRKDSLLNKENENKSFAEKMTEHFFNGKYAIAEHNKFLENPQSNIWNLGEIEFGQEIVVKQPPSTYSRKNGFALLPRPQICAICFFGKVMKILNVAKAVEHLNDEEFLTYYIFNFLKNAKNGMTSSAICAHYSFSQQKTEVDKTDILERYKKLMEEKYE